MKTIGTQLYTRAAPALPLGNRLAYGWRRLAGLLSSCPGSSTRRFDHHHHHHSPSAPHPAPAAADTDRWWWEHGCVVVLGAKGFHRPAGLDPGQGGARRLAHEEAGTACARNPHWHENALHGWHPALGCHQWSLSSRPEAASRTDAGPHQGDSAPTYLAPTHGITVGEARCSSSGSVRGTSTQRPTAARASGLSALRLQTVKMDPT